MMELVVISGKGGVGKTSIVGSLAHLAGQSVLADGDVGGPHLHLLLAAAERRRETFWGARKAVLQGRVCNHCGWCANACRFDALAAPTAAGYQVKWWACVGCGACVAVCPQDRLALSTEKGGEWFESETAYGPLVHARLEPGAANAGKLTAMVRRRARELAVEHEHSLILVDGPPGVGGPVIAAVAGAGFVLLVAEPTVSGRHAVDRALQLVERFGFPVGVCINRWDLNGRRTEALEHALAARGVPVLGRISCDPAVPAAQERLLPVTALTEDGAGDEIRRLWAALQARLQPDHQRI